MSPSASDCLKLGLHLEYLRGINSASARTQNDVRAFPYLVENQAVLRYAATKIVAVLKSLFVLLEKMHLTKSLEVTAEFRPMLAEVEAFLKSNSDPETVTVLDHFANSLVRIAENVLAEVRKEIAA